MYVNDKLIYYEQVNIENNGNSNIMILNVL